MAEAYEIDYKDERFTQVEADKKAALNEVDKTYGEMIGSTDDYYKSQIDATKQWETKQSQLQQEKTDFAIEQIEQKKDQAKKDYTKEQSGAYVDWQKAKNDYGTNAEKMADAGLASSGFSESSQVSMFNTYQNRVMTARETFNRAVLDYDNAIKDARLQNNSALAEIAYNALQKRLELSLQGFQYKNQLILDKANKRTEVDRDYYTRYQDVLKQLNTENALAEQIRQYNEEMALKNKQFNEQVRQYNANFLAQYGYNPGETPTSGGGSSGGGSSRWDGGIYGPKKDDEGSGGGNNTLKQDPTPSSADQLNAAIAAGASKDKVSNAISLAVRNGEISKSEAAELRQTFTPRGYTY